MPHVEQKLVDEAGGCCCICGYHRIVENLHFQDVDPAQKSFPMTMARGKSLAAYRAEAAKCVRVCANCHGEIEVGLIESPMAGSKFPALYGPGRRVQRKHRRIRKAA